ncbi:MAG: NACHT domain-containing NTPase, partial [Xenococcus sp. (in: cyanobacteria)]
VYKRQESCCQWGCNAVELNMPDVNIATETTGQFRKLVAIEEDDSEIESEPLKIILKCKNSLKNLSKESSFSSNIPPELEQELLEEGRRKKYRDNLRSVLDNFGKTILERDEQISDFELKQRETLVNKVKDFWIKGFLKPSLYFNTAVDKDKDHPSGQILRPLGDLEVISFDIDESYDTLLQTDIRGEISDGNTLLILGEPGSGKTIALLQLAEKLIARTKQNTKRPIPVVFNLSSWVEKQLPLEEWLIKELKDKYQVPKVWSESWIREQKLTLLLDGLDEVGNGFKDNAKKINLQSKCIEAINMFISDDHLDTEIVVCSRVKEYEALSKRLLLSSVICIQPLSKKQLLDFLENVDDSLLGLKTVIENDPEIAEFAQTPLILNVMSLAYQDWSTKDLLEEFLSTENLYSQLFNSYIQRMLNSGESIQTEQQYPRDKVLHWLSWLAKQMIEKSKIIFLIEKLKPQSLENTKDRRKYQIENVVLIFGTIYFSFKLMGIVLFLCIYPIVL